MDLFVTGRVGIPREEGGYMTGTGQIVRGILSTIIRLSWTIKDPCMYQRPMHVLTSSHTYMFFMFGDLIR